MDILKKEIAILRRCSGFKEIEKQLQTINKLIVTNYIFELSNGVRIYPIEVEAYFKHSKFNDEFVHGNELQRDNYGRFYVHRTGLTKESKFKGGTRGGIDICLSDSVDLYYGILIRSAKFDDGTIKFGPNNVLKFILEDKRVDYSTLEGEFVLKEAVEAQSEYVPAYAVGEIKQAVKEALENADEDDVILAFGSLSYLGKVKEAVEKEQDKRQMY